MTTTSKPSHIPEFKTREEEAEFWDTHSFADFADELRPVKVHFAKKLNHVLPVRFDADTLTGLQQEASKKGIAATTLIRMWVKERLQGTNSNIAV